MTRKPAKKPSIVKGDHFKSTLAALKLAPDQALDTTKNATNIVEAIMAAYGAPVVVKAGLPKIPTKPVTGLVYGRIQSGKTRAMIASTALAFDNGFRISVVMTSNINDLVSQTHIDFAVALPRIITLTKDTDLNKEVSRIKSHLARTDGRLLLICSKGNKSLNNIAKFLSDIGAENFPTILFDDEGDQASLDTNTRKRSMTTKPVKASPISAIIQDILRPTVSRHVYVSVTGTPQAVLLQSANSANRPSFIKMLPAGAAYIGGAQFFSKDEPEYNPELIVVVDANEQQILVGNTDILPDGLRESLLFFLVSSAAAIKNHGLPDHGRGYSYLCHPSLKNSEQSKAESKISDFLSDVLTAIHSTTQAGAAIKADLKRARAALQKTLGTKTPTLADIIQEVKNYLPNRKLLVINAQAKRKGIEYGPGLNFLIGGNTLGRGIAIRDLLVTYYIREAQTSQIDTMHQHARMFGYRKKTLEYTRVFTTRSLYYKFRDIYSSDEDLRQFIEKNLTSLPASFPIEFQYNLRTTRKGVLDVNKVDTLRPGMHLYPNYANLPQRDTSYQKVKRLVENAFGLAQGTTPQNIEQTSRTELVISAAEACKIVGPIKTASKNTWRDKTIQAVIEKVASKYKNKIILKFREADRTIPADGFMSTGTLSGDELRNARAARYPTLWIMSVKTIAGSPIGGGLVYMYPTLVVPASFPNLFMFNRGQ